ncbi:putative Casein kinase II subunit beta-1 [Paratrimastix pyriformis]|uniref:Casein kinase II subunit beta n=1 Tax=Paratrimastix pyriformis TaxID=342808 RepID=A0ABQ8UD20_9EUKA|nr:putative Casein kinase II subunit beta-1 [Paratrimastix pyriformis]
MDAARDGDDFSSCSTDEPSYDDESWIQWYCSLKGNEFLCEVETEFIEDDFNLTGLANAVPYYDYALDMILDAEEAEFDNFSESQRDLIQHSAEQLYGLIHARFIITPPGLELMREKYLHSHFGTCPRVYCNDQPCLPMGEHDMLRRSSTRLFCPRCEEIYATTGHRYLSLDGAYFGASFPHLFFQQFPELIPTKATNEFIPKIFGFRIHKSAGIPGAGIGSLAPPSTAAAAATTITTPAAPAAPAAAIAPVATTATPVAAAAPLNRSASGSSLGAAAPSGGHAKGRRPPGAAQRAGAPAGATRARHHAQKPADGEAADDQEEPSDEPEDAAPEGDDGEQVPRAAKRK